MQLPAHEHWPISMGVAMMRERPFSVAILASAIWAGSAIAQTPSPGLVPSDQGGALGYMHSLDRSRFAIGKELRRVEENGYSKVVGANGVFAIDLQTGLATASQS